MVTGREGEREEKCSVSSVIERTRKVEAALTPRERRGRRPSNTHDRTASKPRIAYYLLNNRVRGHSGTILRVRSVNRTK